MSLALTIALLGGTMKPANAEADPFDGRYNYKPMRALLLPYKGDILDLILPLNVLAQEKGYVLNTGLPGPNVDDMVFYLRGPKFFVTGKRRLDDPSIEFFVDWFDDAPDDHALDTIVSQLRQTLAPIGPVTVKSAPPGTRPRTPTGYQPPAEP